MIDRIDGDSCTISQIFNCHGIHPSSSASITTLFNERKIELKIPHYVKLKCIRCPGTASNRCLCSNELKCIGLVRERDRMQQNILRIEECAGQGIS